MLLKWKISYRQTIQVNVMKLARMRSSLKCEEREELKTLKSARAPSTHTRCSNRTDVFIVRKIGGEGSVNNSTLR